MTTPNQAAAITAALARTIERRLAQGKASKPPFCPRKLRDALDRVLPDADQPTRERRTYADTLCIVLSLLDYHQALQAKVIARELGRSRGYTVQLLHQMSAQGWVERGRDGGWRIAPDVEF